MIWSLIAQGVRLILDLLTLRYSANKDNALEVLVLRQQIRILERRVGKPVRPSRVEKLMLALTAVRTRERTREGRKWQRQHPDLQASHGTQLASRVGETQVDVSEASEGRSTPH